MNIQSAITLMETNDSNNAKEMKTLLLRLADNILRNPIGESYRTLQKTNSIINRKILSKNGGLEMLTLMGFNETLTEFVFINSYERIEALKEVRQALENWEPIHSKIRNSGLKKSCKMMKPIKLPPLSQKYANPFLQKIAASFHDALVYNNLEARENARSKIPMEMIQTNALKKLRNLQKNNQSALNVSLQELEIVELLKWFKNDFFTWVDSPVCHKCGNETKFTHLSTDEKIMIYTNRIEMYKCENCGEFTQFARYRDLNILLETRKGRCGEWAIVFTLMCFAMGWDSRLILDETDHVWTEVYSHFQRRWIHCDPCDNICDTPLIYEHGWKKKLTYIIAYSPEELQDVTWRYSSDHKELLKRRRECKETELVDVIVKLREERLKTLTPARRKFILNRTVVELSELLLERQPKDDEMQGRSSGSMDWRISRGEVNPNWKQSCFEFSEEHLTNMKLSIKYSSSLDRYETSGSHNGFYIENWHQGIYDQKNMMRKEELDWKQVYLCREEGSDFGLVSWKIVLKNTLKKMASVSVRIDQKTFENGNVSIRLISDTNVSLNFPNNGNSLTTTEFNGSHILLIEARLSGGKGAHSWQHAQLFRQTLDSLEYPFEVSINLYE